MNNVAISVEGLGKRYRIGELQRYKALRDTLTNALYAPFRGISKLINPKSEIKNTKSNNFIWALKDVSFEIKQGEVVGIIGRNGAGKSTLLKILSRITEPTEGYAKVRGRVGSLLEVGTGFHPELTGRENIYLNGSILGMRKAEIERKFDEIVSFAEVEKFIDTPVKHYSSGMYVRLAFAVAAHLEPEILLVDEVLAVGDAAFQKKCLGKMGDVAKEGRTVIFVSHQMDMVGALCSRCILLNNGSVLADSDPGKVIETYIQSFAYQKALSSFEEKEDENLELQIIKGRVINERGEPRVRFDVFEKIIFEFEYIVRKTMEGLVVNFELKRNGMTLFLSFDTDTDFQNFKSRTSGLYKCRVELPCPLLKPGRYSITTNTGIANTCIYQRLEDVLTFDVELYSKPSSLLSYAERRPGMIAVPIKWDTEIIRNY
jgi:lipopolysaccharide transport system ATP-binding protein